MEKKTFSQNSHDPLFDEVAHYVVERQAVSASAISEKFCIGFNRANRIIRQIEESGVLTKKESNNERIQD